MTRHFPKSLMAIGLGIAIAMLARVSFLIQTTQAASSLGLNNISQIHQISQINQSLSLSGTLYRYEPANRKAPPPPLPGYRVYLYSRQANRWIGPSITDSYGRYAFYDISYGTYLLRIYPTGYRGEANQGQSDQSVQPHIWQQEVKVPGKVKPIVLQRP